MVVFEKNTNFIIIIAISLFMYSCEDKKADDSSARIVTDIDGNVYPTVIIGSQEWMAENLKVTKYRDGTSITNVTDSSSWRALTTEAYCIYNNNVSNEGETYGALYNWYAVVDSHNIAPEGWHVPTDDEWKELEMALGMSQSEADQTGWRGTNEGSALAGNADLWVNEVLENDTEFGTSGFIALPGGYRGVILGNFFGCSGYGYFWSDSENNSHHAWYRLLYYDYTDIYRNNTNKSYGFSVRCIKD